MLTSVGWRKLEAFHRRCQRRILGIEWSDFIRNVDVRAAAGQESLESVDCLHRLRLFGYMTRMPDTVPAKSILTLTCEVREGSQKVTGCKQETTKSSSHYLASASYRRLLSHSNRSFAARD